MNARVFGPTTLVFDIETHSADLRYSMPPEQFVRLIGYRWIGTATVLTTDLGEAREMIRAADFVVGHNIHDFDLRALFGIDSNEPLELAMAQRVYDTWTHAVLVHPAPPRYINRKGRTALATSPAQMKKWFALDELAHQLGVPGKTGDLKALAKEFSGFGNIPVDDERFREYLRGDVEASEQVARALLAKGPLDAYAWREQEISARAAVISSNGIRVDRDRAQARVDELAARRAVIVEEVVQRYGLPTEGKSPWSTTDGKAAIFAALADHDITEETRPNWTRTEAGALSLAGPVLIDITEGTSAEDLGRALAELKGQRSLAQLALDSCHPDGLAHPSITMLQRSGRWSTTEPGLTVWTARGEGAVEKAYFVPDSDDDVLLAIDYSNADARVVAALSGDEAYAERFEEGADGHMINALAAWGEDVVATDPAGFRQKAKPLGHGWSYGGRPRTLSRQTGVPLKDTETFCAGMDAAYKLLVDWQNQVREYACRHGYVVNHWGRRMWVEPGREFTQAPALLGQSGTREIVCDALLRMPIRVLRRVKAQIHDEILLSVPRASWEQARDYLVRLMTTSLDPGAGGQRIDFPVSAGPPGSNWHEAAH